MLEQPTDEPLPKRPQLKPWYRLLEWEGKILLQYGEALVSFEGRAVTRLLPVLLPLLDGTRSLDEIVETVGPAVRQAVEHAVSLLHEHGLLTEPPLEVVSGAEQRSAEFLAATDPSGRSTTQLLEVLRHAVVAVVGAGSLASEVASSLRRSGVSGLERRPLQAESSELRRFDLAVVVPDGDELSGLAAWNEATFSARVPWMQVLPFDGLFSAVGPLFVPGETGCHECFRIRRASNVDYGREFLALQEVAAPLPASASLEEAVAGLAATLALRWLAHRDQFLPGSWYALELGTRLILGAHVLYRVPRCPVCSGLAKGAQPLPWHKGTAAAA
jgi:bacteriocin biosynthesis cyclodehydratase domain-containing protein